MARQDDLFEDGEMDTDLSPMIDLVFLLLIFFMVTANLVTYKKDPRVIVPIASDAKVPELIEGRVVVNVLNDGSVATEMGKIISLVELTQIMTNAKSKNANTRLHLRADSRVDYEHIKNTSRASAEGGVSTVIFSTHVVE